MNETTLQDWIDYYTKYGHDYEEAKKMAENKVKETENGN